MHRFNVILPTYNNLGELKKCLAGFNRQTEKSFRVIVCIDGSTDGTRTYLDSCNHSFAFTVVEHPDHGNHGRNAARNLALSFIDAEYCMLLDSDAVPAPGLLEAHKRYLDRENGISLGIIRYSNTSTNLWAKYTEQRGRYRLSPYARIDYRFFNTGNVAFNSRFFLELEGQDASMTHYGGGDSEFAIRLFDRFHPHFFNNTDAVAHSAMNKDLSGALAQMEEFGRYNLRHIFNKHPAHRHLYGMSIMRKYALLFSIAAGISPVTALQKMIRFFPARIQMLLVRYLVVCSVYRGFSLK